MSEPARFLTALSQALASTGLPTSAASIISGIVTNRIPRSFQVATRRSAAATDARRSASVPIVLPSCSRITSPPCSRSSAVSMIASAVTPGFQSPSVSDQRTGR